MICIHHNRDLDGYASAAVVRRRYPDIKLIGWDYSEPLPRIEDITDDVIFIDVTFKLKDILLLAQTARSITIIDHHIGIWKEWNGLIVREPKDTFTSKGISKITYIYEDGKAACEVGWKYLFLDEKIPYSLTLLGRYDTWRQSEGNWEEETLPFQYGMRLLCNSADTFPTGFLKEHSEDSLAISEAVKDGKIILAYQRQENAKYAKGAFEREVGGLRAICLNSSLFNSQVFDTVYNPEKHDIMLPFAYQHGQWKCSLYTTKDEIDCSALAKARGGGGHKKAAGFEVKEFEDIFK